MGRPIFYRQPIRTQAASVEAKSMLSSLSMHVRARRETCLDETEMVARDTLAFKERHRSESPRPPGT